MPLEKIKNFLNVIFEREILIRNGFVKSFCLHRSVSVELFNIEVKLVNSAKWILQLLLPNAA